MSDSTTEPADPAGNSEPPIPPELLTTESGPAGNSEPPIPPELLAKEFGPAGNGSQVDDLDVDDEEASDDDDEDGRPSKLAFIWGNLRLIAFIVGLGLLLFSLSLLTSSLTATVDGNEVECGTAASPKVIAIEGIGLDGVYQQAIEQNACNDVVIDRRMLCGAIAIVGLAGLAYALWRRKDDDAGWRKVATSGTLGGVSDRGHLDGNRDREYPPGGPGGRDRRY